jgi:hypothetical protein
LLQEAEESLGMLTTSVAISGLAFIREEVLRKIRRDTIFATADAAVMVDVEMAEQTRLKAARLRGLSASERTLEHSAVSNVAMPPLPFLHMYWNIL